MSLTSWRRAQGGGSGDAHSDLVILWVENEVAKSRPSSRPLTFTSTRGLKTERRQEGKRASPSVVPTVRRAAVHPWGPLPVHLFQDCYLIYERGGGLDPLTPRQFQLFNEPPGALERELMQDIVLIYMMQNIFFFVTDSRKK